jgi:peptidoglycan/LPS O-acetylase OafA/YrhL
MCRAVLERAIVPETKLRTVEAFAARSGSLALAKIIIRAVVAQHSSPARSLAILAGSIWAGRTRLYRMPATRLGDFAIGIIAALLVRDYMAPVWLSRSAQTIGAGSILALMYSPQLISTAWSWDAAYILPAALLLWGLAAGPQTFLARAFATKPMVIFR